MSQQTTPSINATPKKRHIGLIIALTLVALMLLAPVLIAGWFGFVPGLSSLMGAHKAQNLGVSYTPADYTSYQQKTAVTFKDYAQAPVDPANPSSVSVFADPKTVANTTITQEELTAAINASGWSGLPLDNAQLRLSQGTLELAGNINLQNLENSVSSVGGTANSINDAKNSLGLAGSFIDNAPIYIKATASIDNNVLTYSLKEIKIGRFSLPISTFIKPSDASSTANITTSNTFNVTSAKLVDGALVYTGTYPTTIYVKR